MRDDIFFFFVTTDSLLKNHVFPLPHKNFTHPVISGRCVSNQTSRPMSFAVRNTSSKRMQFKIRAPGEFATFSDAKFVFSTKLQSVRPPRPRNVEEKIEHLERKLKIYVRKEKHLKAEAARLSLKELKRNTDASIDAFFSEDEGDEDEIIAKESRFFVR